MLQFLGSEQRAGNVWTRRELLRVGGLSAMGLTLPDTVKPALAAPVEPGFGRAQSCLVIFLFGGPSQLDMWDMKPEAPDGIRGEFAPIGTNVAGIQVSEHLPRLAQQADKYCLLRSMTHPRPKHGWGLYYMMTGRHHNRPDLDAPPTPDDFPGLGPLVTKLAHYDPHVPPAVTVPRWNRFLDLPNDYAGERAGFLGTGYDPWLAQPRSEDGLSFSMNELSLPMSVPPGRLADRRDLLAAVDRSISRWGERGQHNDELRQRAFNLLAASSVREAFDLTREPERLRDDYGRHPFGQAMLLARRLVEAGTRMIQVNWHNDGSDVKSPFWDTHKDNFNRLKTSLLPPLDESLSALLQDLHLRGLLESTLVLVMGEFGRTPRIGQVVANGATDQAGRDHWPHAYSVLMAGGGVPGGTVYGATDKDAAYVVDNAVTPPDLQATVLHLLGIDPHTTIYDRQDLPHPASLGQPVLGML